MWPRILVRMDMDTRILKKWCAMICKGLLHHLLCRHGRAEIVMKGGQADQPVLRVTTTLSPGPTMAENEALLLRLGALIGSLDLEEDGSRLRLGCQFLLLHLQCPLWTRSPDLLLSNLLSQRDGSARGIARALGQHRFITIASQDGDQEKTIMRPETMTEIGGREHIIMIGMRTVLSRGVMVFELNGRKELSDLTGMTDAREALMRIVQITRSTRSTRITRVEVRDVREALMKNDQITGSIKNIKADVREALMRIDRITRSIKNTRADVREALMRIGQITRITKTTRVEI
jgi:hypothetical protein